MTIKPAMDIDKKVKDLYEGMWDTQMDIKYIHIQAKWMNMEVEGLIDAIQ